jgi:monofunctional biosynthetic peptidoglycan transglycosylase
MFEAYYTLLIELFWSKRRILEIYLNTVDWGEGIMGAEVASMTYFHRSSSRITASQAALLAAVLPNPQKWSPVHPSGYVEERKRRIMRDMPKMPLL